MIHVGTYTGVAENTNSAQPASRIRGKRKKRRIRCSMINSVNCRYDLVRFTATKFGMKESVDNWNVYWTDLSISVQRCKDMKRFQRINHFPGMMEICRKDLLARNLNRLFKAFPDDYDVFPRTWCLPTDMAEVSDFAKAHKSKCFIVKPDQGCQGRGIAITKNVNQLKTYDRMICQQYIQRPFLIDGFKFDLRIYVLITSCEPLRIFVYNEGLARFATAKYKEPNSLNSSNVYMHLTNYSVNKHSRAYIVDDIDGSKRKLSTINHWFLKNDLDAQKIWDSIDDVIIKTMIVSVPTLTHYYHTCFPNHNSSHACFEILGFDFMFDHKLKPYVLEVNHSPSFNTETSIDHEVKESLLFDTFNILNLQHNNRSRVLMEDKKRARDRLFNAAHQNPEMVIKETPGEDCVTQIRVEWENSHLGNYRKIYPGRNDEYYEKFIVAKQNTVYGETVSSKAKETVAKLVGEHTSPSKTKKVEATVGDGMGNAKVKKIEGINKERRMTCNVLEPDRKVEDLSKKELLLEVDERELQKPSVPEKEKLSGGEDHGDSNFPNAPVLSSESGKIDELDEKERISSMKRREFLIKSHGIVEKVYENFQTAGLLKLENDIKMGRSNKWEGRGESSKTYFERCQHYSRNVVKMLDGVSMIVGDKPVKGKHGLRSVPNPECDSRHRSLDRNASQLPPVITIHQLATPCQSKTPKRGSEHPAILVENIPAVQQTSMNIPAMKADSEQVRGKKESASAGLKTGHYDNPGVCKSLQEYFQQRKLLNRSWHDTEV